MKSCFGPFYIFYTSNATKMANKCMQYDSLIKMTKYLTNFNDFHPKISQNVSIKCYSVM